MIAAGQPGVDQRAVERDVDVVQPVADDGQPDRGGYQREGDQARDGQPGRRLVVAGDGDDGDAQHRGQQQEHQLPALEPARRGPPPAHRQRGDPGAEAEQHQREPRRADRLQRRAGAVQTRAGCPPPGGSGTGPGISAPVADQQADGDDVDGGDPAPARARAAAPSG